MMAFARITKAALRSALAGGMLAALAFTFPRAAEGESTTGKPGASPAPDCSGYEALLADYLVVTSAPGEPLETRFDYTTLYQQKDRNQRFALIRQQLLDVTPSAMKDKERLAWAINAYNFLALQAATENLYDAPVPAQQGEVKYHYRNRHWSVKYMSIGDLPFFEAPLVEIEGKEYSLNEFERHFVFADYDSTTRKPPPKHLDPRAHFALNCGAIGCPTLQRRCYRADSLDQQLDRVTREALTSPKHLRWDNATGRLDVSAIFEWYRADFGGLDAAFAFIKRYAPPTVRAEIEAHKKRWWSASVRWDWNLNQPDEPK